MTSYHPNIGISHGPGPETAASAQKSWGQLLNSWEKLERSMRDLYPDITPEEVDVLIARTLENILKEAK